jgi:hypothetical protein
MRDYDRVRALIDWNRDTAAYLEASAEPDGGRRWADDADALERVLAERDALRNLLRCEITNHLCGTDTRMAGYPCQCASCQAWEAALARLP